MILHILASTLGLIILTITTWILLLFFATPLYRMSFYKGTGRQIYFYPILGYLKAMAENLRTRHDVMAGAKDCGRYTPENKILITNEKSKALVVLRDPAYIKEHIQKQHCYHKANIARALLPIMGTGLVLAEDDVWKHHRKIISNSFHYEFLSKNVSVIQETTRQFLDKVKPEEYKSFSVITRIQDITGEIVGHIFFGENLSEYIFEGKPLTVVLAELVAQLGFCGRSPLVVLFGLKVVTLPIFPKFKKIMKRVSEFRKVCAGIIEDRKASPKQRNDLLTSLLATQESNDPSQRFSDEDIINEFITFFIAGMDTTGHLIGMTLYNLAQNPQYLKDLKEEREKIYNKENIISAENLQKMDLLHAMLKETLRMYTPSPGILGRVAVENHKLIDLDIRKGDLVKPEFFAIFYNEKYFKDPDEFRPYRWTTPIPNLDPFAFIPFSAGARNCIGQHLAIFEAKIIISEFLKRFQPKVPENYQLSMIIRFLYEPKEELKLILKPIKE